MNLPPLEESRTAWSRYWASGAASACQEGPAGSGDVLAAFWHPVFQRLAGPARVLDVGTGNGALPALLLATVSDATVQCDAIDLADVQPAWWTGAPEAQRARVRFHGGVAAETMPFADASFDLVVSQYGIEYAERDPASAEVLRVLLPGGTLHALVHHSHSVIAANARAELDHLAWLREPEGWLVLARHMLWPMAEAVPPPSRRALLDAWGADGVAERYGQRLAEANRRVATLPCPDVLGEAGRVCAEALSVAHAGDPARAEALLEAYDDALAFNARRLADMQAAALDNSGMATWCRHFDAQGARAEATEIALEGRLLGWHLQVTRPR